MRPVLIVLAGVCASTTTSLAMWFALQSSSTAWCEVVDRRLIRTTATDNQVSDAVVAALRTHQPPGRLTEDDLNQIRYDEHAEGWFTKPDAFGAIRQRASRLVREQLDEQGRALRVEVLRGDDMPTLVFIEHESAPDSPVAEQVADALQEQGVRVE